MINPSVLFNTAADKPKGAAPIEASQATVSFAQTLRQQTQIVKQATVMNTANAEQHRPKQHSEEAISAQTQAMSAQANADAIKQPQPESNAVTADNTAVATADNAAGVDSQQALPALERRKKMLAPTVDVDMQANAISPWMQTMMAMRPDQLAVSMANKPESLTEPLVNAMLGSEADALTNLVEAPSSDLMQQDLTDNDDAHAATTPFAAVLEGLDVNSKTLTRLDQTLGQGVEGRSFAANPLPAVTADMAAVNPFAQGSTRAGLDPTAEQMVDTVDTNALNVLTHPTPAPQSQSLNQLMVASAPMTSQITVPFGHERWQTAMNQHVMNMVGAGDEVASLTLSPPDLGPIQVVLKIDNQSVDTSFVTDNPVVRQALEDGMQDLRERMASQGLSLGNTFIGNGQQAEQHFLAQPAPTGSAAAASDEVDLAPVNALTATVRAPRGLVDIQV